MRGKWCGRKLARLPLRMPMLCTTVKGESCAKTGKIEKNKTGKAAKKGEEKDIWNTRKTQVMCL